MSFLLHLEANLARANVDASNVVHSSSTFLYPSTAPPLSPKEQNPRSSLQDPQLDISLAKRNKWVHTSPTQQVMV